MTDYRELTKEDVTNNTPVMQELRKEMETVFCMGQTQVKVVKTTPFHTIFMTDDGKHDVLFKLTNSQIKKIKKFIKKSDMNRSIDISEIKNVQVRFMGNDYNAYINMITCGGYMIMSLEDSQKIFAGFSDSIDGIIGSICHAKRVVERVSNTKFKTLVDETKIPG